MNKDIIGSVLDFLKYQLGLKGKTSVFYRDMMMSSGGMRFVR